jgi:hypothetical protein
MIARERLNARAARTSAWQTVKLSQIHGHAVGRHSSTR